MNRHPRGAAARTLDSTSDDESLDQLEALIRLACKGDRNAAHVAIHLIRPHLVLRAAAHMPGCEEEAEDIAHEVLLAMLEGNVRLRRGPGQALGALLRLAGALADDAMRERAERSGPADA